MSDSAQVLLYVMAAYLIGSFPTGVVLSRRKYRIDVREMGSGNIGATNVTRVFGWYAGAFTLIVDFCKGFVPMWWIHKTKADPWLSCWVGLALVAGHCFSLYLRFRGGKGVATSFGCVLAAAPLLAGLAAVTYALLLGLTRISAIGSLGGVGITVLYVVLTRPAPPLCTLLLGISAIVLFRHHRNIARLIGRT